MRSSVACWPVARGKADKYWCEGVELNALAVSEFSFCLLKLLFV